MSYLRAIKSMPGQYHIPAGGRLMMGPLKWDRTLESLQALAVPPEPMDTARWAAVPHSAEMLAILLPARKSLADYRLLFAFRSPYKDGFLYKGAVQHRATGHVVLLNSYSVDPPVSHEDSHKAGYKTLTSDMSAPAFFWAAFKAC
jgi:hypothetical protein